MPLSKGQKAQLENCAKWSKSDDVELHVVIGSYIPYTREFSKGYPIGVKLYYTSEPVGYDGLGESMSRCQERYTAFDKAKEIARYLVDVCNVSKSKVSIKSKIGVER